MTVAKRRHHPTALSSGFARKQCNSTSFIRLQPFQRRIISAATPTESWTSVALPTTYKRLIARRTGRSFREVAEVDTAPLCEPGPGEVLVQVLYAGINGGCETFRCRGEYAFGRNTSAEWFALGAEGTGRVVAVGHGVATLSVGDHVMFIGGAFSEYITTKESMCFAIPHASPELTALRISGHVAYAALHHVGCMRKGDTVLVTAAGGATGSFAVQYAKLHGCYVVATCGNEEKETVLRDQYGVDRVVNYTKEVCLLLLVYGQIYIYIDRYIDIYT